MSDGSVFVYFSKSYISYFILYPFYIKHTFIFDTYIKCDLKCVVFGDWMNINIREKIRDAVTKTKYRCSFENLYYLGQTFPFVTVF